MDSTMATVPPHTIFRHDGIQKEKSVIPSSVSLLRKNATFPRNSQQTSCDQNWSHMFNSKSFTRMGSAWLAKTSHFTHGTESCEGSNIWTNPGYLVGNQECLPQEASSGFSFLSSFCIFCSSPLIAGLSALLFYALGVSVCICLFNSTHFFF